MTITYTRPIFDQYDNKLLKKRSAPKQISASYSTVRLLDYLDEIQKLKENKDDPPNYMFGKHSLTPWYSHNFIDKQYDISAMAGSNLYVTNGKHQSIDHNNYQKKMKLPVVSPDIRVRTPPPKSREVIRPDSVARSRECRKTVITPQLDYDGFSDKKIFSPYNYNWSVRPRLTSKK